MERRRVAVLSIAAPQNYILQLTDALTARRVPMRIDPEESTLPLGALLARCLREPPVERLVREQRITPGGVDTLQELQDLVYTTSDSGLLGDLYRGIVFRQQEREVDLREPPAVQASRLDGRDVAVVDVEIDRFNVGYDRNWVGFQPAEVGPPGLDLCRFRPRIPPAGRARSARPTRSWDSRKPPTSWRWSGAWRGPSGESDFESYSRFTGGRLRYKTGDQTVSNVIDGGGGICSEKVQALKFLTDHYGIRSEYILAGPDVPAPVPEERLRELLTTFDFRLRKRYLRYWQHTALLYTIGGTSVLVDATNGNIPFLFLEGGRAERVLGYEDKPPVTVRMAVYQDDFYYHRVSQDIPENLFFAMESWIPDIDLVQVFDNELGLYISPTLFVTPVVFRSQAAFERQREAYVEEARAAGMSCVANDQWTLESSLGQRLLEEAPRAGERIASSEEHLVARCDDQYGPGHQAGLVLISLDGRPG